ncbi:MAG TPA: DUF5615 family PIN-like protein [Chthoniobacterales bacterium]|nr:DUF5615 family PIN-like protein [Chthoniobacterales bacterium]
MKFVVDAQLPPALARLLREAGCEANDAEIWRYALQQQAAIITKDEDFAECCINHCSLTTTLRSLRARRRGSSQSKISSTRSSRPLWATSEWIVNTNTPNEGGGRGE